MCWFAAGTLHGAGFRTYQGCCDASAAAPVNATLFAVASDEDNVIRLFRRDVGGPLVAARDVSPFLGVSQKDEGDFEGAARIDDHIFWIGSHSRNSDGRLRPARHALIATHIRGDGEHATLDLAGRPFTRLLSALAAEPALTRFELRQAAGRAGEAAGGLNIEGLAAGTDQSLLIGFRNPVPEGRALIVPIMNALAVIGGATPRFGEPLLLPLNGLGIRDLTRIGNQYLIVAGPAEGGGRHRLFLWGGGSTARPQEVVSTVPKGFQAESLLAVEGSEARWVELLSDDGGEKMQGVRCEDIKDSNRRAFRAVRIQY